MHAATTAERPWHAPEPEPGRRGMISLASCARSVTPDGNAMAYDVPWVPRSTAITADHADGSAADAAAEAMAAERRVVRACQTPSQWAEGGGEDSLTGAQNHGYSFSACKSSRLSCAPPTPPDSVRRHSRGISALSSSHPHSFLPPCRASACAAAASPHSCPLSVPSLRHNGGQRNQAVRQVGLRGRHCRRPLRRGLHCIEAQGPREQTRPDWPRVSCAIPHLLPPRFYLQVFVPHTAGRYQIKRFRKAQCPIVERLVNSLMRKGRNNGKKTLGVRIVQQAFEIIHLLTDENPLQVRAWCCSGAGLWGDDSNVALSGRRCTLRP